jgi:hypothetical protein
LDVPTPLEHHRYVGDKRTQLVYDLELLADDDVATAVRDLVAAEAYLVFGPDTLPEARNRGYRPHRSIGAARDAAGA